MDKPSPSDAQVPPPRVACGLFVVIFLLQVSLAPLLQAGYLWTALLLGQLGAVLLPTLGLLWWGGYSRPRCLPFTCNSATPWKRRLGIGCAVILSAIAVVHLTDYGIRWTRAVIATQPLFEEQYAAWLHPQSWPHAVLLVAGLALLPACTEELLFRGVLYGSFAAAYGPRAALLLSSILFAIAHGNPSFFHLYFGLGCYLGALRRRSDALWWPILAHAVNNTWTLVWRHF